MDRQKLIDRKDAKSKRLNNRTIKLTNQKHTTAERLKGPGKKTATAEKLPARKSTWKDITSKEHKSSTHTVTCGKTSSSDDSSSDDNSSLHDDSSSEEEEDRRFTTRKSLAVKTATKRKLEYKGKEVPTKKEKQIPTMIVSKPKRINNATKSNETSLMKFKNVVQSLEKTCNICYGVFPKANFNFFAMIECTHTFCQECAVGYFTIQITERTIFDCSCPICDYPKLHTNNGEQNMTYFSLLVASLKPVLDENIYNLFERKLTESALASDPNFTWCIRCTSGFVKYPNTAMTQCPECRVKFCVKCKKVWETQHEGLSCEQFADWQKDNNVELSNEAIMNYLQKNGIDCPKCKFKYGLSRGGCIHFTCTQCRFEFCFGCRQPFLTGARCSVSSYCKRIGLHSHHLRNCYYYLRDRDVLELQNLLKVNNIHFMTERSENILALDVQREKKEETALKLLTKKSKLKPYTCPIELQIETSNGIIDTICKELSPEGYAGLCQKHYSEYLIMTITKAKLETLSILTVHNCHELLRFQGISLRRKKSGETDSKYKKFCEELVKEKIAL